jgi:tRNA dimethylallyltransferase
MSTAAPAAPPAALPPAVCLMGPTAAGKTDLAITLVERLPLEIVSVDSALVYRGMDIGTAKPDAATLARAPHRLVDICDPAEAYSAARFRDDALREMTDITAHGRVPLLVGGTMLYFRALLHGLADLPAADAHIRARLQAELARDGLAALHRRLAAVDPQAAARIHPNDPQRTLRALEVWESSGQPLSELHAGQPSAPLPYRVLKLIWAPPRREVLWQRIAQRFDAMLAAGLVEEVRALLATPGMTADVPALRAVGYRQVAAHLRGEYDAAQLRERAVAATRQLAKRQMTWLRAEAGALWLDPDTPDAVARALRAVARHLRVAQ